MSDSVNEIRAQMAAASDRHKTTADLIWTYLEANPPTEGETREQIIERLAHKLGEFASPLGIAALPRSIDTQSRTESGNGPRPQSMADIRRAAGRGR
jgi:hypothetical protein